MKSPPSSSRSMSVDNETDTQQFMMPIMLPLILAVYVGFATVINDPHGPISVIFSYIPFKRLISLSLLDFSVGQSKPLKLASTPNPLACSICPLN